MSEERVEATIDLPDDGVVVPLGITGAAAEGGFGGAMGAADVITSVDEGDEAGAPTGNAPGLGQPVSGTDTIVSKDESERTV